MDRPPLSASKSDWIDHAGRAGVDPVGKTKAELVALTDATSSDAESGEATVSTSTLDGRRVELFTGPALSFQLTAQPQAGTVEVRDGIEGRTVDTTVEGRTIRRTAGHFGRGGSRWHVTYTT